MIPRIKTGIMYVSIDADDFKSSHNELKASNFIPYIKNKIIPVIINIIFNIILYFVGISFHLFYFPI